MKLAAKISKFVPNRQTALGVDISDGLINMALLRQSAKGLELLKAASAPVPDGAIKDGNIEDAAKLARAIKELKTHNRIRSRRAAISLFARPVVMQILDTPKGAPISIGQFVRNEMKSYVMLSGREFAFDFCGIGSGQGVGKHLLAAATEDQNVAKLAHTAELAGLNVELIEPLLLSCTRALYAKKIAEKFDCDVLIAILRDGVLTLCVFRKQNLDFVKVEDIPEEKAQPDELCRLLAEKINEIIRFYNVEDVDSSGKWEVTVVTDRMELPRGCEESLKTKITKADVQVRTGEDVCQDTVVVQNDSPEKASVVAIGLAIGLLKKNDNGLRINLVPPESAEIRAVKKQLCIAAGIIAAVLLLMILGSKGLSLMADKMNRDIAHRKQTELSQDTYTLLGEQDLLDKQIKQLSDRPAQLSSILGSRYAMDWAGVLEDIGKRTPKTVRIINISSRDSSMMYLEGLALSYEAIHIFVKMLNNSNYISSASLSETVKEDKADGLITYTINCSLNLQKENG